MSKDKIRMIDSGVYKSRDKQRQGQRKGKIEVRFTAEA